MVVGAVGALLALLAMSLLDRLRIDDPVGCVAVHFCGAIWGGCRTGLFGKISIHDTKQRTRTTMRLAFPMPKTFCRNAGRLPIRRRGYPSASESRPERNPQRRRYPFSGGSGPRNRLCVGLEHGHDVHTTFCGYPNLGEIQSNILRRDVGSEYWQMKDIIE